MDTDGAFSVPAGHESNIQVFAIAIPHQLLKPSQIKTNTTRINTVAESFTSINKAMRHGEK